MLNYATRSPTKTISAVGKRDMFDDLRRKLPTEEFDYQALLDTLREYDRPRDKITNLLRQGAIVRIKKGIYVFGEKYRRTPLSREVLANMIYGPSYISLDYALHYYGMIPERVESVTSVTCNRGRRFSTPVGLFIYRGISMNAYQIGIDQISLDRGRTFLMAIPEKALSDKIHDDRGTSIRTQAEMRTHLLDNLRIDPEWLKKLDAEVISIIADRYHSRKIRLMSSLLSKFSKRKNNE